MKSFINVFQALALSSLAGVAVFLSSAPAAWAGVPTISVEQMSPLIDGANEKGTRFRGYGLTVFEGTEPERFEVEFRSILWNHEGKEHRYLVKLTDSPNRKEKILAKATIVSGMSGSPVYVTVGGKDKLVGAVSFGFPFAKEWLGGVTPIEYMLAIGERPLEKREDLWDKASAELPGGAQKISTPLYISGFAPKAMGLVRKQFQGTSIVPMAGGGSSGHLAEKYKDVTLKPGSAIGLQLVSGDFDWTAAGTVTWVDGDKILAFGHSFYDLGEAAYPLTTAYVQAVIPVLQTSFKLSSPIRPVGSSTQDRNAAVAGLLGKTAKMIPVRYVVRNIKQEKIQGRKVEDVYNVNVANDNLFSPFLMRMVLANVLSLSEPGAKDNTVFIKTKIKFKGYEPIEIDDAYYNFGEAFNSNIFNPVAAVTSNPMKKVALESLDVEISIDHDFKIAYIAEVRTDAKKVKPGKMIDVAVTLASYNRDNWVANIKVPIPADIQPGTQTINIYGGGSVGWLTDLKAFYGIGVKSVEDMLALFRERIRGDAIVSEMVYPTVGIRVHGKVYPNIPDTVRWTLMENNELEVSAAEQAARHFTIMDWAVYGGGVIQIEVEE